MDYSFFIDTVTLSMKSAYRSSLLQSVGNGGHPGVLRRCSRYFRVIALLAMRYRCHQLFSVPLFKEIPSYNLKVTLLTAYNIMAEKH